jgi:hypothetical protein
MFRTKEVYAAGRTDANLRSGPSQPRNCFGSRISVPCEAAHRWLKFRNKNQINARKLDDS